MYRTQQFSVNAATIFWSSVKKKKQTNPTTFKNSTFTFKKRDQFQLQQPLLDIATWQAESWAAQVRFPAYSKNARHGCRHSGNHLRSHLLRRLRQKIVSMQSGQHRETPPERVRAVRCAQALHLGKQRHEDCEMVRSCLKDHTHRKKVKNKTETESTQLRMQNKKTKSK